MIWTDLPSLTALRAFAAVAEAGSYSRAGAALNVSHAAVSQQVRTLEERLGVGLVARQGRGIALTAEGAALARDLATGFAAIRRGVEALSGAAAARPLQITMTPAFAVSWLLPRIADFQRAHPEVELMLNPTAEVVALTPGGIDLAIRYGDGRWPGLEATLLLPTDFVVVGAPGLIGAREVTDPAMLVDLPWLQELGTNEVLAWMERQGVRPERQVRITHMPGSMIMDAVRRGDGLTYTARRFVEDEIRAGELLALFSERDAGGYYLVTRPGVRRPPVRAFERWLKRQVSAEAADCA